MLNILMAAIGILLGAGLFVWRFVLLRDRHPNTDLYLQALHALERNGGPRGRDRC